MTTIKLRYVDRFRDRHGHVRYYLRPPGMQRVPLPGLPGSAEFMEAYQRGLQAAQPTPAKPRAIPGSLDAAAIGYLDSQSFRTLRDTTQAHYRRVIDDLRGDHGTKPLRLLDATGVRRVLEAKKGRPAAMNRRLRMLRLILAWAREHGLIDHDPTRDISRAREPGRGFRPWEEEHIAQFRARHPSGTPARLALELLLNTGQRRSDVVRMGRQHVSAGVLRIRQSKTGEAVEVPILPELHIELDQVPAGQLTFLVTVRGGGHTSAGFYQWFQDRCAEAELPAGLAPHGLRKACGRRLAEAGCTALQIMAVLGHRTLQEAQKYIDDYNRTAAARQAIVKLRRVKRGT